MGGFGTCSNDLQAGCIYFVVVQVCRTGVAATMNSWSTWDNPSYCWIVICKNKRFHRHENTLFGHRVPLGETDAFSPPPAIDGTFQVRCDECGEEYAYRAADILRIEQSLPESFTSHPLFRQL
jgi:hypothetical protein